MKYPKGTYLISQYHEVKSWHCVHSVYCAGWCKVRLLEGICTNVFEDTFVFAHTVCSVQDGVRCVSWRVWGNPRTRWSQTSTTVGEKGEEYTNTQIQKSKGHEQKFTNTEIGRCTIHKYVWSQTGTITSAMCLRLKYPISCYL